MDQATFGQLASCPAAFRRRLLIDTVAGPRVLADVLDAWQAADFGILDPAWQQVVGQAVEAPYQRAYLERPRGHAKTSDLACMAAWALFASRRPLSGVAAAADVDQARLLVDAITRLVQLNPWLAEFLVVQRHAVVNPHTGSEVRLLSGDVASSWGLTPDFVLCDELVHWSDGSGESLWHSLFSAAAKRRQCLLCVISNAGMGMGTSWQWHTREAIRNADHWYFRRLDGPCASWIGERQLAEQERLLPPAVFARLWLNIWQADQGDALPESDIRACLADDAGPMFGFEADLEFIAGLDLSTRRDFSALTILGIDHATKLIHLADVLTWKPFAGSVDLIRVERDCLQAARQYRLLGIAYDPYQAHLLAQRLRQAGVNMVEIPFTSKNLDGMARDLLTAFRERRIRLYEDAGLLADLRKLRIVERQFGQLKLTAAADETGHADRAIALAICLGPALQLAELPLERSADDVRFEVVSY